VVSGKAVPVVAAGWAGLMAVPGLHVRARAYTAIVAESSGVTNAVAKPTLYGDFLLIELATRDCQFHTPAPLYAVCCDKTEFIESGNDLANT